MLIVCPSCATPYDVELASLGPFGRQVRCSRCRAVWYAAPARAERLLAAAEAIAAPRAAQTALEIAGAEPPPREPAVEEPTEGASELRRRLAALDEPQGEEAEESEAVDAPAAEPKPEPGEALAGKDADFPDVPRAVLPPGEMVPFRGRLASLPADAQEVLVRFVNRRDVLAGTC